jgi:hypothetical protein
MLHLKRLKCVCLLLVIAGAGCTSDTPRNEGTEALDQLIAIYNNKTPEKSESLFATEALMKIRQWDSG